MWLRTPTHMHPHAPPSPERSPTKMATAGPGAFNPRNCSKVVALKRWQAGLRR